MAAIDPFIAKVTATLERCEAGLAPAEHIEPEPTTWEPSWEDHGDDQRQCRSLGQRILAVLRGDPR
jgi:hypothetical protein